MDSEYLKCNCCKSPMKTIKQEDRGGAFKCTQCDQVVNVNPDGTCNYSILAKLFPSNIEKGTEIYREFIEYQYSSWEFIETAYFLLGQISNAELNKRLVQARATCDDALEGGVGYLGMALRYISRIFRGDI